MSMTRLNSPRRAASLLLLLAGLGCKGDDPAKQDSGVDLVEGVFVIDDPARAEHFFDRPFPDDALRQADGRPDTTGFPVVTDAPLGGVAAAWAAQAAAATDDFGANAPVTMRFEGPLQLELSPEGLAETAGLPDDPVLLINLATGQLYPLSMRWVDDPLDDPFFAPNLLTMVPALGHTPEGGATLAAVVMASAGAAENPARPVPEAVRAALAAAGVTGAPAASTTYTVQRGKERVTALTDAGAAWMRENVDWGSIAIHEVRGIRYTLGLTESGKHGTAAITTYADGREQTVWLAAGDPDYSDVEVIFDESYPMVVYEALVPLPNFSGLDDRPYMSPGAAHLLDGDRGTGWIDVSPSGEVRSVPDEELVRVVIQLPKGPDGRAREDSHLVIWDHGTGGTAYNILQRKDSRDKNIELIERFAAANLAVVSHDAPLYGSRFPLIDSGFTDGSLGYYNIANLPAFRDNQVQTGVEGNLLLVFAELGLPAILPEGGVLLEGPTRAGHSLGSVTTHIGMSADPSAWAGGLASGSGGVFALNFLETGLGGTSSGIVDQLSRLFGVEVTEDTDIGVLLAAAVGIDDPVARARFDRLHPAVGLFQWIVDPADPSTLVHSTTTPVHFIQGIGDYQVPNSATAALMGVHPAATVSDCHALADYDPHHCTFREQEGFDALSLWLGLPE